MGQLKHIKVDAEMELREFLTRERFLLGLGGEKNVLKK